MEAGCVAGGVMIMVMVMMTSDYGWQYNEDDVWPHHQQAVTVDAPRPPDS